MERFKKILQNIRGIKIQGATSIALAGVKAFLLNPDKRHAIQILKSRITEPMLQNSVNFLLASQNPKKQAQKLAYYIKKSDKKIFKQGAKLIKNNTNIFTHCHSSTVIGILKEAKKQKKHFVVYNTETEPLLQGRKTAEELAKIGIKVIHVPDTATEYTLKYSDLFLFGADAFTEKGVVNKVGTAMYSEIAKRYKVPVYAAGISLKFTKKVNLEFRSGKELWDERNKNISVLNPAFDVTPKNLVKGVISEFGILSYNQFIKKAKQGISI